MSRERGHLRHDYPTGAHPAIIAAYDSLLDPGRSTRPVVNKVERTLVRRTAAFIAQHFPGVHPNDLGSDMVKEERRWVASLYVSEYFAGRRGGVLLFDELKRLGLRDASLPNPFGFGPIQAIRPPVLPPKLAEQRRALVDHYEAKVRVGIETYGAQGRSTGWKVQVVRTFDGLLGWVEARNTTLPEGERVPLTLEALYADAALIGTFLQSGVTFGRPTRGPTTSEGTRLARKAALAAAYRFFLFRKWVRPGFTAELNEFLRGDGTRAELGGRSEKTVVALEVDEMARVRQQQAQRVARAEHLLAQSATPPRHEEQIAAHRSVAIIEWMAGTAIREQGIAWADLAQLKRTPRGSWYLDRVRWKHGHGRSERGKQFFRRQWVPRQAIEALVPYLKVTGRSLPGPGGEPAQLGTPVVIPAGGTYAGTVLPQEEVFYPIFRDIDGSPMTPQTVQRCARAVLRHARCQYLGPHSFRHWACWQAINVWHATPVEAAAVFGWTTVELVLERYSKGPVEQTWERFDGYADRESLAPSSVRRLLKGVRRSLREFLAQTESAATNNEVANLWTALTRTLDQLADVEQGKLRPSDGILLSLDEWAKLDLFVRQRTDRHETGATLLGRKVEPGLLAPVPPVGGDPGDDGDEDDEDEGLVVA